MDNYKKLVQLRWSDMDPNFHVRHSVYYDWGALVRAGFLQEQGLTLELMQELKFGPILFREECTFRREIRPEDQVNIFLELTSARNDYSRWSVQHHIINQAEKLCAVIKVDGAWIDTSLRKLSVPPEKAREVFEKMPRSADFKFEN